MGTKRVDESFFFSNTVSANVRRFRSNQGIKNINNIHMDRVIQSFVQRNQNIYEKTKSVDLD